MLDLHVHSNHSCDSEVTIDEYCKRAIELGLKYICFTDHIDFNENDIGYGYYEHSKFFYDFNKAKDEYSDRLIILSGIEFSEPHIYRKEFEQYRKLPYDFILGSVHFWYNDMFPSEMLKNNIPISVAFEKYWDEVFRLVSYGGFDALAHMDFPKRYYKNSIWNRQKIEEIFKEMLKKDIALEINTSSLRKGLTETMPDKDFLEIYQFLGGSKITIGADTHSLEELANGYKEAVNLLIGNLQSVVYINRKAKIMS